MKGAEATRPVRRNSWCPFNLPLAQLPVTAHVSSMQKSLLCLGHVVQVCFPATTLITVPVVTAMLEIKWSPCFALLVILSLPYRNQAAVCQCTATVRPLLTRSNNGTYRGNSAIRKCRDNLVTRSWDSQGQNLVKKLLCVLKLACKLWQPSVVKILAFHLFCKTAAQ